MKSGYYTGEKEQGFNQLVSNGLDDNLPRDFSPFSRTWATDAETRVTEFTEGGLDAELKDGNRLLLRIHTGDIDQHEDLFRQLIHQTVNEKTEG